MSERRAIGEFYYTIPSGFLVVVVVVVVVVVIGNSDVDVLFLSSSI